MMNIDNICYKQGTHKAMNEIEPGSSWVGCLMVKYSRLPYPEYLKRAMTTKRKAQEHVGARRGGGRGYSLLLIGVSFMFLNHA